MQLGFDDYGGDDEKTKNCMRPSLCGFGTQKPPKLKERKEKKTAQTAQKAKALAKLRTMLGLAGWIEEKFELVG